MDTLIKMNVDELNISFLDFIKQSFKGKKIAVHVYEDEEMDETDYLLSTEANKKHLEKSIAEIESGKGINFTLDELKEKYATK
ncbi:MAG TPA: hypothetical protein VIQ23_11585 [Hanamia sp.]|jgi:hypothetical protein